MKILMIMPVPLPPEAIEAFSAQIPATLKRPDLQIDFTGTRNGATLLDSPYEMTVADNFVLDAGCRAEEQGYDAVCINSMSDSGLSALRSRLTIPVVGPGQACFLSAMLLGDRIGVITMWPPWHSLYHSTAKALGIEKSLVSVRDIDVRPDTEELLAGKEAFVFEALESAARAAIDQDGANVLILGSTTMHQSYEYLKQRLEVPLLNPGLVALKHCEMLLELNLSHSKVRYPTPSVVNDVLLQTVPTLFE
ncbi:MAG: aspartate/glutamate racemase family protein [Luminiphilus sp.]|nr:aspartate/glutamate racemase family protein [Luminiphilus sp.]